jgi:hypothetical protein
VWVHVWSTFIEFIGMITAVTAAAKIHLTRSFEFLKIVTMTIKSFSLAKGSQQKRKLMQKLLMED